MKKKRKYKPSIKTLENIVGYFDDRLHSVLSVDDELYLRWQAHDEAFKRRLQSLRERWRSEWEDEFLSKYQFQFRDGIYEKGQIIKKLR